MDLQGVRSGFFMHHKLLCPGMPQLRSFFFTSHDDTNRIQTGLQRLHRSKHHGRKLRWFHSLIIQELAQVNHHHAGCHLQFSHPVLSTQDHMCHHGSILLNHWMSYHTASNQWPWWRTWPMWKRIEMLARIRRKCPFSYAGRVLPWISKIVDQGVELPLAHLQAGAGLAQDVPPLPPERWNAILSCMHLYIMGFNLAQISSKKLHAVAMRCHEVYVQRKVVVPQRSM